MNKYTFKSGATVEGSIEQILSIGKSLGETVEIAKISGPMPTGYYKSESKGLVKVSDMADAHIKNALIKTSKDYYENLRKRKISNSDFMEEYTKLGDNPVVLDLFAELAKRK